MTPSTPDTPDDPDDPGADPDGPPESSVQRAFELVFSASERGIDYEEYAFEVEGGENDGVEFKVLVMRV
jgi:hypothetical protein